MNCERCGGLVPVYDASEDWYNGQAGSYYGGHLWVLCLTCFEHLQEIIEHAAQGGAVQIVDDDRRIWTYAVEDGTPIVKVPSEELATWPNS